MIIVAQNTILLQTSAVTTKLTMDNPAEPNKRISMWIPTSDMWSPHLWSWLTWAVEFTAFDVVCLKSLLIALIQSIFINVFDAQIKFYISSTYEANFNFHRKRFIVSLMIWLNL